MQKLYHVILTFIILRKSAWECQDYFAQFCFSGTQILQKSYLFYVATNVYNLVLASWWIEIERRVFLQILYAWIISDSFQQPSQEGLLENVWLKKILCNDKPMLHLVPEKFHFVSIVNPKWSGDVYFLQYKFSPYSYAWGEREGT